MCVVGRGVARDMGQWARLGGKEGMCKKSHEDVHFFALFTALSLVL